MKKKRRKNEENIFVVQSSGDVGDCSMQYSLSVSVTTPLGVTAKTSTAIFCV